MEKKPDWCSEILFLSDAMVDPMVDAQHSRNLPEDLRTGTKPQATTVAKQHFSRRHYNSRLDAAPKGQDRFVVKGTLLILDRLH